MSFKFNLGDEVKTKITGFKGIIRGRTDYLTGCNHYGLQSEKLDKDGNPKKWQWFDEEELVLIKAEKIKPMIAEEAIPVTPPKATSQKAKKKVGGPRSKDQISRS